MSNISEKIKDLRLEQGLTQPQLAKAIGVSNGTISFWENGLNTPNSNYIIKLAKVLQTTTEYLLSADNTANTITNQQIKQLSQDEIILIEAYRNMSQGKKQALFSMLDITPHFTKLTAQGKNNDNSRK